MHCLGQGTIWDEAQSGSGEALLYGSATTSQFPRLAIAVHIAMCRVGISSHIIMWVHGLVVVGISSLMLNFASQGPSEGVRIALLSHIVLFPCVAFYLYLFNCSPYKIPVSFIVCCSLPIHRVHRYHPQHYFCFDQHTSRTRFVVFSITPSYCGCLQFGTRSHCSLICLF
jgi:hypothetical protein